jgi:hypothetical protein
MDVILGAPPVPPEYAQAFGQPGFGVMPPIEY